MANIVLYVILAFSLAALGFCLVGFTRALRQERKNLGLYARIPDVEPHRTEMKIEESVTAMPQQASTEKNFPEPRVRQTRVQ